MAKITTSRSATGGTAEPLSRAELSELFDAICSPADRDLKGWPQKHGGAEASWTERSGQKHQADDLDELLNAYEARLTFKVSISTRVGADHVTVFNYWPGHTPPKAEIISTDASEQRLSDRLAAFTMRFPRPASAPGIFVSYDTSEIDFADFIKTALTSRLGSAATVFVAKRDIAAGSNPLDVMLKDNLLSSTALVALCSARSKTSPWIWWEAGSVWARGGLVVPLFLDILPGAFGGPLTLVSQGRSIRDRLELDSALQAVVLHIDSSVHCSPLTDDEWAALPQAAPQ